MENNNNSPVLDSFMDALKSNVTIDNTILLDGTINPQITNLLGYINLEELLLHNVIFPETEGLAILEGDYQFIEEDANKFFKSSQSVILFASVIEEELQLTLKASPEEAFDLEDYFPYLPPTFQSNSTTITIQPSIFYTLPFRDAKWWITTIKITDNNRVFVEGLNLNVYANIATAFPVFTDLIQQEDLEFNGPIDYYPLNNESADELSGQQTQIQLNANFPTFSLHSDSKTLQSIVLNGVGLSLKTYYDVIDPEENRSGTLFYGLITIGNANPKLIKIGADIQLGNNIWAFSSDIPDPITLVDGLSAISEFVGGNPENFILPDSISILDDFGLSQFKFGISPTTFEVNSISLEISSTKVWNPPIPFTTITDLSFGWQILNPFSLPNQTGGLGGTLIFGEEAPIHLAVNASLPDFTLNASLVEGDEVSLVKVLETFFSNAGDITGGRDIKIDELDIRANFYGQQYDLQASIKPVPALIIDLGKPSLTSGILGASFGFYYDQNSYSGSILGKFKLFNSDWTVLANYNNPEEWIYSLSLDPGNEVDLSDIVRDLFSATPANIPEVAISVFYLSYTTAKSVFNGEVTSYWDLGIFLDGGGPKIIAGVNFESYKINEEVTDEDTGDVTETEITEYKGAIYGDLTINAFEAQASYNFAPDTSTLAFSVRYKTAILIGSLVKSNVDTPEEASILRIGFGDLTFDELVEYFVNLANPDAEFKLEAPWTVLSKINFKNLFLTANLNTKEVSIEYALNLNLVFVDIKTLGLRYVKENGKGKVKIKFDGRLLNETYTPSDPVTWDLLNDPPPIVPAREPALFKLKYLGIGQHIAFENSQDFNNMEDVIVALKAAMQPPEDKNANPLDSQQGLRFDENSHWLFGLDIEILKMISLSVVFNDPNLYGLLIELGGERSGVLSGLKFQVLYVKVTPDIGVFKVDLQIPEAFRQLEFGEVSITLPNLKLEVYTNGNFMIDIGFPTDGDFTQSFCLQVFPFIGFGGFYFASLNGATSDRVPEISNGTFAPVIELGIGLSIGVGRTFNKGMLKAGLALTVEGILEGCLAWFNPDDSSKPAPMYYWSQGTVGLVGKLYGYVDFKVIKVDISVIAYASTTLIIEAYEPVEIEFKVGVKVNATAKILFKNVSFSFEEELEANYVLGAPRTSPWILGPRQDNSQDELDAAFKTSRGLALPQPRLRMQRPTTRRRRRIKNNQQLFRRQINGQQQKQQKITSEEQPGFTGLTFDTNRVFDTIKQVHLTIIPTCSVAAPDTLINQSGENPEVQVSLLLMAENTIPVSARDANAAQEVDTAALARTDQADQAPFNLLVRGMLSYALNALDREDMDAINAIELEVLYELLDQPAAGENGFSYVKLTEFISNNFIFEVSGVPVDTRPNGVETNDEATAPLDGSATIFPMIPELNMLWSDDTPAINFSEYHQVAAEYEDKMAAYFDQLAVDYMSQVAASPFDLREQNTEVSAGKESIATMIFRDYFWMIAKAAVQEAQDLMSAYPYQIEATESLFDIANSDKFPTVALDYEAREGDTLDGIADQFSMTPAAIRLLNPTVEEPLAPSEIIKVTHGVTVVDIAIANQDVPLNTGEEIGISGVNYQVLANDSLAAIAEKFELEDGVTELVNINQTVQQLLLAGQSLRILDTSPREASSLDYFYYPPIVGDEQPLFIAAYFIARKSPSSLDLEQYSWYLQTIADLNPSIDFSYNPNIDINKSINKNMAIRVPGAYLNSNEINVVIYYSRLGDTLPLIATYFTLYQNPTTEVTDYVLLFNSLNPSIDLAAISAENTSLYNEGTTTGLTNVRVPAIDYLIQETDTFFSISNKLQFYLEGLGRFNSFATDILAPLAVLRIPPTSHLITEGETLSSLAAYYNLTVADLAILIEQDQGLFAVDTVLTIPDVPQLSVETIQTDVVHNGHSNKIAGMVSRFLLYGLRLPWNPAGDLTNDPPLYSIYDLSGQQFAAKYLEEASLSITKRTQYPWLELMDSYVIQPGDTVDSLEEDYPSVQILNPQINWAEPLQPGWIVFTASTPSLNISDTFDADYRESHYPSTQFLPSFSGPTKMDLFHIEPRRYSLQANLHWQTPETIVFPNPEVDQVPVAGEPSIWYFPAGLQSKISANQFADIPFELCTFEPEIRNGNFPKLDRYFWATTIEFQIRQVTNPQTEEVLSNTYELVGAAHQEAQRLNALINHFATHSDAATDLGFYILYPPNATSSNPNGLMHDTLELGETFLLKTNLSTQTVSPSYKQVMAKESDNDDSGDYFATLNDPLKFMRFLWEGSVVSRGGFHLQYTQILDAKGLPATTFDESGLANMRLLVVLDAQKDTEAPLRAFESFNNCAVIGDNIDSSEANIFAEAMGGEDLNLVATVPPGNIGFEMTCTLPVVPETGDLSPANKTRALYSLLGYQLLGNDLINTSTEGLPIGPTEPDNIAKRQIPAHPNTSEGYYHQVLPIAKFAKAFKLPASEALPDPTEDPYAAIGLTNNELGDAHLHFSFHDILGNKMEQDADGQNIVPDLAIPIGYYDEIIGLSQWPGLVTNYRVEAGDSPKMYFELALQIGNYIPGGGLTVAQAITNSSAHLERYQQIWYQCLQADLDFKLITSLYDRDVLETAFNLDKSFFVNYLNSSLTFIRTTQYLEAYTHEIVEDDQLATIKNTYSITYSQLAEVNAYRNTSQLFNGAIQIPYSMVVVRGQTLLDLEIAANDLLPPTPLTILEIVENNPSTRIIKNTVLAIPPYEVTLNTLFEEADTNNLLKIANQLSTTVGGLAMMNAEAYGIISPDIILEIDYHSYTTELGDTLQSITNSFNILAQRGDETIASTYTVSDIAVANQTVNNLLTDNVILLVGEYVSQSGDTFAKITANNAHYTTTELINHSTNQQLPNIFEAGQSLYLFRKTPLGFVDGRLSEVAQTYGVTTELLLSTNSDTPLNHLSTSLNGPNVLTIPGLVQINEPADKSLFVPYTVKSGDSLDAISTKFTQNMFSFCVKNEQIPYLFIKDQPINIQKDGLYTVLTNADDSMATIIQRFEEEQGIEITLQDLVGAINQRTNLLANGAYLAMSLPNISSDGTKDTLQKLSDNYNVSVENIAVANASTLGFLKAEGQITYEALSLSLKPFDTLNSLVTQFKTAYDLEVTVQDLAKANKDLSIIAPDITFLLPPVNPVGLLYLQSGHPYSPQLPATIFEISTSIKMERTDKTLIDPDFILAAAVLFNYSTISPKAISTTTGELSLVHFAQQLELAFDNQLKVAIAKTDASSSDSKPTEHIWGVYFGEGGIADMVIHKDTPSYFALPPLFNRLISRLEVPIQKYQDGNLTEGPLKNFKSIDVEVWAKTYLEAIDLILSAPYAVPTFNASIEGYEKIVKAKEDLAEAISKRLDYILVEDNNGDLASAQAVLKDSLLDELSSADDMDTLLQYQANVTANYETQPTAPKFIGRPVNRRYETGQNDNLETIATQLQLSTLYVGETLRYIPQILNTGLVVSYPDEEDYIIAQADTLETLLRQYYISMEELINGLTWDNQSQEGLFAENVIINITPLKKEVGVEATFENLAFYFDKSVADVALANKDTSNIFIEGVAIKYEEEMDAVVVTAENNTLQQIADAFDPPVSPEALAERNRITPNIFNPTFNMRVLEVMPEYTISSSKLPLANGENTMNFMLNVKSETAHRHLLLTPDFYISELEYNIQPNSGPSGYQDSDWLTFLIPIEADNDLFDIQLGQPEIPLPTRSFPTIPTITSQSHRTSYVDKILPTDFPDNMQAAKEWDFAFNYQHKETEQDISYIRAYFNTEGVASTVATQPIDTDNSFFENLAQFIDVWPDLSDDLTSMLTDDATATLISDAVNTFATLVENVANNWPSPDQIQAKIDSPSQKEYRYSIRYATQIINNEVTYRNIILRPEPGYDKGPNDKYPTIYWENTDFLPTRSVLLEATPNELECVYTYPEMALAFQPIQHKVVFENLDIMAFQNALAGASVKRNQFLVEQTTKEAFVYQSPEVVFKEILVPTVTQKQAIQIQGTDLQDALTALFDNLLDDNSYPINIAAKYGFPLVKGTVEADETIPALISQVPIAFRPKVAYSGNIPSDLSTVINNWQAGKPIDLEDGRYIFDLIVFFMDESENYHPFIKWQNIVYFINSEEEEIE